MSSSSTPTYILWHYAPSVPAAVIFALIFAALTATHLFLRIKRGTKLYNPLIAGGIFEALGYCFRIGAHYQRTSTLDYAFQSLLILLGPILFAASVYMYLGRLILASGSDKLSPVPPRRITKMFVCCDITCFLVQAGGGAILTIAKSATIFNLGNWVIVAGLALQVAFFGGFLTVARLFHIRYLRCPHGGEERKRVERQLTLLYVQSGLIAGRNIYRVIEYGMGQNGYLIGHEWVLYLFDAVPMSTVLASCLVWYTFSLEERPYSSSELNFITEEGKV